MVPGLTYVGRLDVMTSGLLLLTTDGGAAHRLMHPRFAVPRTYWLRAHGLSVADLRRALALPIVIDGRPVRVMDFRVRPVARSVEVELTLAEGRQRIVRRLAEALGLKGEWLHRVAYGPVRLGRLAEGKHRRLSPQEVEAIERLHGTACSDGDDLGRERAGRARGGPPAARGCAPAHRARGAVRGGGEGHRGGAGAVSRPRRHRGRVGQRLRVCGAGAARARRPRRQRRAPRCAAA